MPWPPPSVVPHLFLSNLPPNEIEIDLILKIVLEAELLIGRIRKQLQVHPRNRVLKNQLRNYETYLTRHRSILSPLRRLPPELLYQIFEFLAPPPLCLNGPNKPTPWSTLPWGASQACHRWRAITLSMPKLWNRIPLLIPDRKYTTDPSFLEFYSDFLLRSVGQPIGVFVSSYDITANKAVKWNPAIKILVSYSYRWQHLSVVSHSSHIFRAFRRIKKRLPILRTLNLEIDPEACLNMFRKAPMLSQVRLMGIAPERIALPWKQLVHYKGKHDELGATTPLRSGPSLETLELQSYCCDDLSEASTLPIVLPNLVALRLCGVISTELTIFLLETLTVPAVEEIAIFGDVFNGSIPIIPLVTSMISRSTNACILQRLSIGEIIHRAGQLTALLRLTPRLVFLHVKLPPVDDLVPLGITNSTNSIVPLLHTLVISDDPWLNYAVYPKDALNLLAKKRCEEKIGPLTELDVPESSCSRTPPIVPLRIFRMNFSSHISRCEAKKILNGWTYQSSELYPPHSESMLFCDWASELAMIFPQLIPSNNLIPSENFYTWVKPLTKVQKVRAFIKAMVNHQLEEVAHLFKFQLLVYLDHLSHIHLSSIPGPVAEGIRTQASFVLEKWRSRVIAGFNNHR